MFHGSQRGSNTFLDEEHFVIICKDVKEMGKKIVSLQNLKHHFYSAVNSMIHRHRHSSTQLLNSEPPLKYSLCLVVCRGLLLLHTHMVEEFTTPRITPHLTAGLCSPSEQRVTNYTSSLDKIRVFSFFYCVWLLMCASFSAYLPFYKVPPTEIKENSELSQRGWIRF